MELAKNGVDDKHQRMDRNEIVSISGAMEDHHGPLP